jgi:hypothetical protein
MYVDSYGHALSHQVMSASVPQGRDDGRAYPVVDRYQNPTRPRLMQCCENQQCGSPLGLVLFRWVAHPLQPRVVGPYLVWGVWFPNCLPLEGTDRIQDFRS